MDGREPRGSSKAPFVITVMSITGVYTSTSEHFYPLSPLTIIQSDPEVFSLYSNLKLLIIV